MGLDVYGYRNVKQVVNPGVDDIDELTQLYFGSYSYQGGDLVDGGYYDYESCDSSFSMGYGRYSGFRQEIAIIAGYEKVESIKPHYSDDDYETKSYYYRFPYIAYIYVNDFDYGDLPFLEMIAFSDAEGVICSKVCKKLYDDFVEYQDKAKEHFSDNEAYLKKYMDLMECFKCGSNDGFVIYR